MARRVHWTNDPRFCHLRAPPAWYQRQAPRVFAPGPSRRMEKQAAAERKRQWQWQSGQPADRVHENFDSSCVEATFWPCGIYSRTSHRLRAALGGRDAINLPGEGCCNAECVQFGMCLPFYGCFLAKLQTTARSFYDIDGSDVSDWHDGFCCPCLTIVRAEHEILFREKQHRQLQRLHEPGESVTTQYTSHSPMSADDSFASNSSNKRNRTPSPKPKHDIQESTHEANEDAKQKKGKDRKVKEKEKGGKTLRRSKRDLSSIPEAVSAPGSASHGADEEQTGQVETGQAETEQSGQSGTSQFPLLKYLDKLWYLVPANKKENSKPGEPSDSGLSAVGLDDTDAPPMKHLLPDDAMIVSRSAYSPHTLDDDAMLVDARGSRFTEHLLENDFVATHTVPTIEISHPIDNHSTISRGKNVSNHDLGDDHTAPTSTTKSGNGRSHRLEDDEQISVAQKSLKHHLDSHKPTSEPARSTSHGLEQDDEPVSPTSVSSPKLGLEKGQGPKSRPKIATHNLDDEVAEDHRGGRDGQHPKKTGATHELHDDVLAEGREDTPGAWPTWPRRAPHGLNDDAL